GRRRAATKEPKPAGPPDALRRRDGGRRRVPRGLLRGPSPRFRPPALRHFGLVRGKFHRRSARHANAFADVDGGRATCAKICAILMEKTEIPSGSNAATKGLYCVSSFHAR